MRPRAVDYVATAQFLWLALVLLFVLAPIALIVVYAFSSAPYGVFPPPGLSTKWFVKLFHQDDLTHAALNSLIVALATMAVSLMVGTLAALALVRYRFFGRELVRAMFLAPLIVPRIALGVGILIYVVLLHRFGGLDSVVMAHVMVALPFVISVLSASLIGADRVLEEAAMDLGATPVETFFRVVLPQIRTGLIVSAFFAFITSWDEVETSIFLVKTHNIVLPVAMFYYLEHYQDPVIAALSVFLIVIALAVAVMLVVLLKPRELPQVLGNREPEPDSGATA
ncbi:MAG TPA: ABC transporter permease [bacterium]|nr:ABC transporter permease [bacterium]